MNNRKSIHHITLIAWSTVILFFSIFYISLRNAQANLLFGPKIDYNVGYDPISVAIGDLNGDSFLDLAVAYYGGSSKWPNYVSVLLGKGDGRFQNAVNYGEGVYDRQTSVAIGDLNGDGNLDLAMVNRYICWVSVLLGRGDGSFGRALKYRIGCSDWTEANAWYVSIGDLNGDGDLDLAVALAVRGSNQSDNVSVLLGNGDGSFQSPVNFGVDFSTDYHSSIAIGDINEDGHLDLVTNGVWVLLGNGDGTFQSAVNYEAGYSHGFVAGDLNGDGDPDLAQANRHTENVSILINSSSVFCEGKNPTILGNVLHEYIKGTSGPDVIHGLGGHDVINGLGGDDIICGGDGNDTLLGREGHDILRGEGGHDVIWGGNGDDLLDGGEGDDSLDGKAGNDRVYGDLGNDTLKGGEGKDYLHAGDEPDNNDTCYDTAGTVNYGCEVFYVE